MLRRMELYLEGRWWILRYDTWIPGFSINRPEICIKIDGICLTRSEQNFYFSLLNNWINIVITNGIQIKKDFMSKYKVGLNLQVRFVLKSGYTFRFVGR